MLEGRGILEEVLAVVLEGVTFLLAVLEGVTFLLAVFWRSVAFFAYSVLEGCGILGECFGGMTFWKRRLEGCGIFGGHWQCYGGVLAVFWRGVAFLKDTCYVLEGCFQCFGGVWHFWRALAVFWRGVAFFRDACSVLEGHDILEEER